MEKLEKVAKAENKTGVEESRYTIDLDNEQPLPWDSRKCEWYTREAKE